MNQIKRLISDSRNLWCAGFLLCLVGLVAAFLAVSAYYGWWWILVAVLFVVGLLCWVLPSKTSRLWSMFGLENSKQKAWRGFLRSLANDGGPTREQIEEAINGADGEQHQLLSAHEASIAPKLRHFENIEEHRLSRMHFMCLAGTLLTFFSFLAVHVPSQLMHNLEIGGTIFDGAGNVNQVEVPTQQPERVAQRIGEIVGVPPVSTPDGPEISIPEGTIPDPNKIEIGEREDDLGRRLAEFEGKVKSYSEALDNANADSAALEATKTDILETGKSLEADYRKLSKDASAAGLTSMASSATETADSVKKMTESVDKKTDPKAKPGERKKEGFEEDLKEFLEFVKEVLKLLKEIWDALKEIFPELGEGSEGEGEGSEGEGSEGEGGEGTKPSEGSKPGKSGTPSPTKRDTKVTFPSEGTFEEGTSSGGRSPSSTDDRKAGSMKGKSEDTPAKTPTEKQ